MFVPVVDVKQKPLMPTTSSRARRWIRSGKATPFWKRGMFCIRLNVEPSSRELQDVSVGIDPGSKREGFTVGSEAHQYLNLHTEAVQHVKDAVKTRREMRRGRRERNTPCRANRRNRSVGRIPPSTRARWGWKLRISAWLSKVFPISAFVVEDISAHTHGGRRWNLSFSPLQVGKKWFYTELRKISPVFTKKGWETKDLRSGAGFKKSSRKLAEIFEAHCVDSYVLMRAYFGNYPPPENKQLLVVSPLRFHRRQLHRLQPAVGGVRKPYGGTRSLGFKRGSLVRHPKYGVCFIGGASTGRISLHSLSTGARLCQNAKSEDITFLAFNSWRTRLLPMRKCRGIRRARI